MIFKLFALFFSIARALAWPVLRLFHAKHEVLGAGPSRAPPDPLHFPNYLQNKQGLWLYWREWRPTTTPVGVVFLVGGLAEHHARYDPIAARFTARGFLCFSMDHQGQGGSEGERKYVERFHDYVDDLEMFVQSRLGVKDSAYGVKLVSLPRFILGHSMGGLITTHFCLRHPTFFYGAVLSAPAYETEALDVYNKFPIAKAAARFLSGLVPKLPVDKLNADFVSRNPQVVTLYKNDPIVPNNMLALRFGAELMGAMDAVWENTHKATFPFLLLHGTKDKLVSISGSEKFAQRAASTDKKFCVYDDVFHEPFTDTVRCEDVFRDVFAFVDGHMKATFKPDWTLLTPMAGRLSPFSR